MKFSVLFQSLTNEDVLAVVNYADNNLKVVKFIPDRSKVLSKKLQHDYYGIIPISNL